jgi:hypothetical protein
MSITPIELFESTGKKNQIYLSSLINLNEWIDRIKSVSKF